MLEYPICYMKHLEVSLILLRDSTIVVIINMIKFGTDLKRNFAFC